MEVSNTTVKLIRIFITNIYNFLMHILDFFDPPVLQNPPQEVAIQSEKVDNDITLDLSGSLYTPLYFDNLSYSDFVNNNYSNNFWGGNENYINDLFFATSNDDVLDINRPFSDKNIQVVDYSDSDESNNVEEIKNNLEEIMNNSVSDYDDMPDLVSISSDDECSKDITPLKNPLDTDDDFECIH